MRLSRLLFNKVELLINSYSNFNPSPLSLKRLIDFGKHHNREDKKKDIEIQSYEFLKEELLVRLALMSKEMFYLPENLIKTSSVKLVYGWYLKSFEEILTHKSNKPNEDELKKFNVSLKNVVERHSDVVQNMAMGILQLQETYGIDQKSEQKIQYFLDRFLMSRISIRMLINQHLLMFSDDKPNHPHQIGAIDPKCKVLDILEDAYDNAKFLCDQYYLCSPDIKFQSINVVEKNKSISLVYVPSHLYQIAFELFKNAMRAIIEYHGSDSKSYPAIETLVVKGEEDVTIRITDYGGGIPVSKIPVVFKYMYSTASKPTITPDVYSTSVNAPLAGYGYGLPLSRLYARYFNGDLVLSSIDGYCTQAYIYLKTLSKDANESLPIYNRTTALNYKNSAIKATDWI